MVRTNVLGKTKNIPNLAPTEISEHELAGCPRGTRRQAMAGDGCYKGARARMAAPDLQSPSRGACWCAFLFLSGFADNLSSVRRARERLRDLSAFACHSRQPARPPAPASTSQPASTTIFFLRRDNCPPACFLNPAAIVTRHNLPYNCHVAAHGLLWQEPDE